MLLILGSRVTEPKPARGIFPPSRQPRLSIFLRQGLCEVPAVPGRRELPRRTRQGVTRNQYCDYLVILSNYRITTT